MGCSSFLLDDDLHDASKEGCYENRFCSPRVAVVVVVVAVVEVEGAL